MSMPIIFIGTNKARVLFQNNLRLARRVQSDGYFEIGNLKNHSSEWSLMTKYLFNMSVVGSDSINKSDINEAFYDETQGIIALLVMLFVFIQNAAMLEHKNRITPEFIHKIAKRDLSFVQPMVDALRSNNPLEISKYDDLTVDEKSIVNQYQHDIKLDEERNKMIEDIIDKTKDKRKTIVDNLCTDFYVSGLFKNLTQNVIKRLILTIVNENPLDMDYDDLKDLCHDKLYEENKRCKHKKIVKPEVGVEGLVKLYNGAIINKQHPYDILKENGYIKDPNIEFFRA